jgi:hypothetical protein
MRSGAGATRGRWPACTSHPGAVPAAGCGRLAAHSAGNTLHHKEFFAGENTTARVAMADAMRLADAMQVTSGARCSQRGG